MKRLPVLVALLPSLSMASPPLCHVGEVTFISCAIRSTTIALCHDHAANLLRYRQYPEASSTSLGSPDPKPTKFLLSETSAARWTERHVRFEIGQLSYVVYDRWHGNAPPARGGERSVGVATFSAGYLPSNGEKAEFKREFLVEEARCSTFAGVKSEHWPSNLGPEEFLYWP